jgi:transposase
MQKVRQVAQDIAKTGDTVPPKFELEGGIWRGEVAGLLEEDRRMPALAIRQDLPSTELRRLARFEPDRRAAMRLSAIANALEGMSRAEAARLAGMERQALRDAVLPYNAEGVDGLHDRPRSGRSEALTAGQQAALRAWVLSGPKADPDGVSAWRLVDIYAPAEDLYGVRYSEWGMSCLLRRLRLSREKARPEHPQGIGFDRGTTGKGAWVEAERRGRPGLHHPALV